MSHLRKTKIIGTNNEDINSFRNALNVHDADVHRTVLNRAFKRLTATATTLSSPAAAQDYQIVVTSATGFVVGDHIVLQNGGSENVPPKITAIAGTTFTLDRRLDLSYAAGSSVTKAVLNMNATGTMASPVSFKVQPPSGEIWHLRRILIEMTHGSAGDNGLFGNLTALTNGVVLRVYNGTAGLYGTFTIWKTNGDIVTDMYDITYAPRSGGGGTYGTNARGTFKEAGAVVYLDGTAGDFLEVLVQDDLSTLSTFRIKAQGHEESV